MRLQGRKVETSRENNRDRKHFALDFVRRSQSFLSISASCLPHFSSTERNRLLQNTHTHTPTKTNSNTHVSPIATHKVTKCKNIKKSPISAVFLQCILRHDKLYVQTAVEKRSHLLCCLSLQLCYINLISRGRDFHGSSRFVVTGAAFQSTVYKNSTPYSLLPDQVMGTLVKTTSLDKITPFGTPCNAPTQASLPLYVTLVTIPVAATVEILHN